MKTVVLINVGTPDANDPESVGRYLKEFLMDENIISIPRPFRDILVKGLIVPKRKFTSSEKYQRIWTDQGSPLMVESISLKKKLEKVLGPQWRVLIGMQIGNPSLKKAIDEALNQSDEVIFCPLYPQFAMATTGGAIQMIESKARGKKYKIVEPFYSEPWFIDTLAAKIKDRLGPEDHLLFSYHGLPVSQLKSHRQECYKSDDCCLQLRACAENCYKAQCVATTHALQKVLGHSQTSMSFQSRLGRARWIEPSTEDTVNGLLQKGVKHLKVACPSFVADCLETLEEIGLELKHQFLSGGGQSFELIACVNDDDRFVEGLGRHLAGN